MKLLQREKPSLSPQILGRSLHVDLPKLRLVSVLAKVDTGAYSGALHATNVEEIVTPKGRRLKFKPLGQNTPVELAAFHRRKVKSSNGAAEIRYAIDTVIIVNGRKYPITLTLANRQAMKYPLLIGRNFLREQGFVIDVSRGHIAEIVRS